MSQTDLRVGAWRFRSGFTLVELMVTIFVAAVLIAIAVPSFKHVTASSRLTTMANSMVSALHVARMEAIKRNDDTQFCGTAGNGGGTLDATCGTAQPGAVYALTGTPAAPGTVSVQAALVVSNPSMHIESATAIRFGAQGLGHLVGNSQPYSGTVAVICSSAISSGNVRTISMVTGSIVNTKTSKGECQ